MQWESFALQRWLALSFHKINSPRKTSFVRPKPGNIFLFSLVETPETYHRRQQGCVATRQQLQLKTSPCSSAARWKEARSPRLAAILRCRRAADTPAPHNQLRSSIMRDTSGDAPPQLVDISLSFEHVTGCHMAHRDRPGPRHFPSLCETVQVNPLPRCFLFIYLFMNVAFIDID